MIDTAYSVFTLRRQLSTARENRTHHTDTGSPHGARHRFAIARAPSTLDRPGHPISPQYRYSYTTRARSPSHRVPDPHSRHSALHAYLVSMAGASLHAVFTRLCHTAGRLNTRRRRPQIALQVYSSSVRCHAREPETPRPASARPRDSGTAPGQRATQRRRRYARPARLQRWRRRATPARLPSRTAWRADGASALPAPPRRPPCSCYPVPGSSR